MAEVGGKEPDSVAPLHRTNARELRRRILRRDGLPVRPATARAALVPWLEQPEPTLEAPNRPLQRLAEVDPGWALARLRGRDDPREILAHSRWWPPHNSTCTARENFWRHSVAASFAARKLAEESGRGDAETLAHIALVQHLGLWALAAEAPELLEAHALQVDPVDRRAWERVNLGTDLATLGRDLAEIWGLPALVADSAWLAGETGQSLGGLSSDQPAQKLLHEADAWAGRTPWAREGTPTPQPIHDPRVRLLVAKVQARCGSARLDEAASDSEERLARGHARLLLKYQEQSRQGEARRRLVQALAESPPLEARQEWADRVAGHWCRLPGVASARVEATPTPGPAHAGPTRSTLDGDVMTVPLGLPDGIWAEVALTRSDDGELAPALDHELIRAWAAWGRLVCRLEEQRDRGAAVFEALRAESERGIAARASERLDALAEFAAGAAHELNNPLAVIMGRAQLLIAAGAEPGAARSLRAIVSQAQRAHRILRDLMYIARPPAPRPRRCFPAEILRSCLADLRPEAEARGVRLLHEWNAPPEPAWHDPDGLRQLSEVLLRNALEATPSGGTVHVRAMADDRRDRWVFHDGGPGLDARAAVHRLDPFYCGRQAGRGLGLGLSRAARFLEQIGGELCWRNTPQGAMVELRLPRNLEAPSPAEQLPRPGRAEVREAGA